MIWKTSSIPVIIQRKVSKRNSKNLRKCIIMNLNLQKRSNLSIFIDGWLNVHVYHFHPVKLVLRVKTFLSCFISFIQIPRLHCKLKALRAMLQLSHQKKILYLPLNIHKRRSICQVIFFSFCCLVILEFFVLMKIYLTKLINYFWLLIFIYWPHLFCKIRWISFMLWCDMIWTTVRTNWKCDQTSENLSLLFIFD